MPSPPLVCKIEFCATPVAKLLFAESFRGVPSKRGRTALNCDDKGSSDDGRDRSADPSDFTRCQNKKTFKRQR